MAQTPSHVRPCTPRHAGSGPPSGHLADFVLALGEAQDAAKLLGTELPLGTTPEQAELTAIVDALDQLQRQMAAAEILGDGVPVKSWNNSDRCWCDRATAS